MQKMKELSANPILYFFKGS